MRISVVLPVYNEAKWMHMALGSLVDQTVPFELIVVDNESTDDSSQVARRYTPLVFTAPRGKLNAKQLGVVEASGDVVVFVDADVYYPPSFIETLTRHFNDPFVVATVGYYRDVTDKAPRTLSKIMHGLANLVFKAGSSSVTAYRRDAFLRAGGYNLNVDQMSISEMVREEEVAFNWRINQFGRIVYDPSAEALQHPRRSLCVQCPNQGEETLCQYCREIELGQRF